MEMDSEENSSDSASANKRRKSHINEPLSEGGERKNCDVAPIFENSNNNDSGMCSQHTHVPVNLPEKSDVVIGDTTEHAVKVMVTVEDHTPNDSGMAEEASNVTIDENTIATTYESSTNSTKVVGEIDQQKPEQTMPNDSGDSNPTDNSTDCMEKNVSSATSVTFRRRNPANPTHVANDETSNSSESNSNADEQNMLSQHSSNDNLQALETQSNVDANEQQNDEVNNVELENSPDSVDSLNEVNIAESPHSEANASSLSLSISTDDCDSDAAAGEDRESPSATDCVTELLDKPKPPYTWHSINELMRREHGLPANSSSSLRSASTSNGFNARYYASRHVIERMKHSHSLRRHSGCVNCLNFNRGGELLCSGSDDCRIIVWNWAENKPKHVFKSGHTENIFQTKFINSIGCLDIISTSRDGQVRRSIIPPSGGMKVATECLYKHRGPVHKLVICPQSTYEIISVGEDASVRHFDLRSSNAFAEELVKVSDVNEKRKIRLFSISHHPFAPEFCVSGSDNFVRVYDKRNCSKTVYEMCPTQLLEVAISQVTCAVYNSVGSEILASYSDDHIYLFNNKNYKKGEFLHRYRGHYNHRTIKGVNFFGPNSEYVISGSDCGNIFFWDKNTEAILNSMPGDTSGVVNCLEPHPWIPVLATSGLDNNVKIWTPSSENYPPDLSKLEQRVKRNLARSVIDEANDLDDRQFHYFIRHFLRRHHLSHNEGNGGGGGAGAGAAAGGANEHGSSSDDSIMSLPWATSSSSSSGSSHDDDDVPPAETLHCRTQ